MSHKPEELQDQYESYRRSCREDAPMCFVSWKKHFHPEAMSQQAHTFSGECKPWGGTIDCNGYGRVHFNGKTRGAHRVEYEKVHGKIPEGMVIDHLCRNRACVNVAHLEVVTPYENGRRGFSPMAINARKTTCERGHPLEGDNLEFDARGHRHCTVCRRAKWRAYRARKIQEETWAPRR